MGDYHTSSGDGNYSAGNKQLYKIIVAGGRDFKTEDDYLFLERKLDILLSVIVTKPDIKVVFIVGKAKGADTLGERYAISKGYDIEPYPVTKEDWARHGKYAGHLRNQKMADAKPNALVAFWDKQSKGTRDMIERATKKGITVRVFHYDPRPKDVTPPRKVFGI